MSRGDFSQPGTDFRCTWVSPVYLHGATPETTSFAICCSHFACCLGDTLASELGILSSSPPVLITTFKPVPHGTNGGISLGGTLASIGGGTVMGLTFAASLILENSRCTDHWVDVLIPLVAWGTAAGGLGSMVDSFLGATIQRYELMSTPD